MASTDTIQGSAQDLIPVRDAEFKSVYANNAVIIRSDFDTRFIFGDLNLDPTRKKMQLTDRIEIVMSHAHAQSFLKLLEERMNDSGKVERGKAPVPKSLGI